MTAVQTRGLGVAYAGRWLGLVAGLAATSWLLHRESIGPALLLVGPVLGIALLGGVLLGELAAPGPDRGPARRALLETRRAADYLPASSRLVVVLVAVFVAVTAGTSLFGVVVDWWTNDDPLLIQICPSLPPFPWPDAYYAGPTVAAVLLGLGLAAAVLRRSARRPGPAGSTPRGTTRTAGRPPRRCWRRARCWSPSRSPASRWRPVPRC